MGTQYRNKEWLVQRYEHEGWSQNEIAEYCDVTQGTIYKWMKKFNIPSRDISESHLGKRNGSWIDSPIKNYQWMYREYVLERKTLREIATNQGVALRTVSRWINTHNIDARQGSEAIVSFRGGEHNPNWKGGSFCPNCGQNKSYGSDRCKLCHFEFIRNNPKLNPNYSGKSDLTCLLRSYTRTHWAPKIFERDNYICMDCGSKKGGDLNAHHIVPFVVLRDQMLLEKSNLDITNEDDKLAILDYAKRDWRFNDLDNGITLCQRCHIGEHQRIRYDVDEAIYVYRAKVIKILDPDTITVDLDIGFGMTKHEEIRLYGINAPETHSKDPQQNIAIRGKNIIKEICAPGREVLLRTFKPGKYGRWLALVMLDSKSLNHALVKHGLAKEEYYV